MGYEPIKVIAWAETDLNGHVNRVTEFDETSQSNKLSYRDGFPHITCVPNGQNTRGPRLVDYNGLFYLFSNNLFELQQGNFPTYNSAIVGTGKPLLDGYPLGAVLWYPAGGYFVKSIVANNTNSDLNDPTAWVPVGGASKNIGEVFFSESHLAADNPGALPLFTGETISNFDEVYPGFWAWLTNHNSVQISAADYATAITTYGECAKYVVDTINKTVTLPLLKNFVKMANTTDGITEGEAGLPNITGTFQGGRDPGGQMETGPFYEIQDSSTQSGNGFGQTKIGFDLSRSNAIYGNSNTVTPPHTTLYPWVFAFNVSVPASVAQAAEFQGALSGKADTSLANIVSSAATNLDNAGIRTVTETYVNGTSWYRVWSDGWCEQGGLIARPSSNTTITVTLLKPYKDTNWEYVDSMQLYSMTGQAWFVEHEASAITGKTNNSFTRSIGSAASYSWEAKGYIS